MDGDFVGKLNAKKSAQRAATDETRRHFELLSAVVSANKQVVNAVTKLENTLGSKKKIEITNQQTVDMAKTLSLLSKSVGQLQKALDGLVKVENGKSGELSVSISGLTEELRQIDFNPTVNVPQPKITVNTDLKDLNKVLNKIEKSIGNIKIDAPSLDTDEITDGLSDIEKAIKRLIAKPIPVPVTPSAFANGAQPTVVTSTSDSTVKGIIALNPDGSNISGGGSSTYPSTPSTSSVTMTGSSITLKASNTSRRGLYLFNDSGVTTYVKCGTAASSTSFTVKLVNQSYYEFPQPVYTGIVTAMGTSGDVRVTEVS